MDVCGIDPGLEITGYAVIRVDGHAATHPATILDAGVLRTAPSMSLAHRLIQLADGFAEVLSQWRPAVVGVEQLYAHYKHPRTAIQMGHARGVLLAAAGRADAEIHSLAATRIKRFLTGNGRASKQQVQQAVKSLFNLREIPEPPDVADALAVAFSCANEVAARVRADQPVSGPQDRSTAVPVVGDAR